ncbi:hypothetical protein ACV1MK_06525 [Klebsiella michiganensis]
MTKSTITRERLEELASGQSGFNLRIATLEESQELARMALAAFDSEPVGEFYEDGPLNWYQISDGDRVPAHRRIPLYRHAQPAPVTQQEQMFGIGSIFKPLRVSEQEADCDDCVHYQPQICHGEGCPAILEKPAQPAPVVQCVPLGDSPYDVPYSMPSNLRELIAEEIGILFSDDDAQSVWNVCRSAAILNGGKS